MSISGLGLFSQHNMDEAVVSQPAQQAKAAVPANTVNQQAGEAFSQASYQSTISAYGQAQNAMAYLRSVVPGFNQSAHSGDSSSSFRGKQNDAALSRATQVVQSFVDAYNASPTPPENAAALRSIGITSNAAGVLALDAQTFQKALTSNPKSTLQVFSSLAESMQPPAQSLPLYGPAPG